MGSVSHLILFFVLAVMVIAALPHSLGSVFSLGFLFSLPVVYRRQMLLKMRQPLAYFSPSLSSTPPILPQ